MGRPGVDRKVRYLRPCPARNCTGQMKLKQNRDDQSWFWGCNSFPGCKMCLPLDTTPEALTLAREILGEDVQP